jgi:hypothetical protein
MTASLLTRKGDAAPSFVAPVPAPSRPALVPRDKPLREPRQPDSAEKLRRTVISLSPEELDRLRIAAIKKGTSRHDIVRAALNDYFRKLSAEFPHPCACIESSSAVPARLAELRAANSSYPARAENLDSAVLATTIAKNG